MLRHVERCEPGHVWRDFVDGESDVMQVAFLLAPFMRVSFVLLRDADHHVALAGGSRGGSVGPTTPTSPFAASAPVSRSPAATAGRRAGDLDVKLRIHRGSLDEGRGAASIVTRSGNKHQSAL